MKIIETNLVDAYIITNNVYVDDVMVGKFITQFLKIPIDPSAKRIDINPKDIPEDLDMSCYHYRVINNGNANSLYRIHELKCKNQ